MMKLNSISMENEQSTITADPPCQSCQHAMPPGEKFFPSYDNEQLQVQTPVKKFCIGCGANKPFNAKFYPAAVKKITPILLS
jgi:hypothetical protein